jgi:CBS domain
MYSELCEKLFEQNANNYIAIFNELDKHFDVLADSEKFMPFNEKVKNIAQSDTSIGLFVKKYELRLKYFGELRNHIAHGFKLDGKHYAIPSYHALDELNKIKEVIMQPVTCGETFTKQVYTCQTTDTLHEVMQMMKNFNYTHVPIYNETRVLQGVLTQSMISERLEKNIQAHTDGLETTTIGQIDLRG